MRVIKKHLTCSICGSNAISWNASAEWNFYKQRYEYYLYDDAYCNDCSDDCHVQETIVVNKLLERITPI